MDRFLILPRISRNGAARARWMCRALPARLLGAFLGFWRRRLLQKCKPLRRLLRGLCCASALIRSSFRGACCCWAWDRVGGWYSFCGATEKPPGVAAGGRGGGRSGLAGLACPMVYNALALGVGHLGELV